MSNWGISVAMLLCVQAAFVFCICYAIVSDFTRLRIANWIPATLTALFLVYAVIRLDVSTFGAHLMLAGMVFAFGFVSFVLGWVGGGDVKLMTALTLWAGPSLGPDLLILTTLGGGIMAFALLLLRNSTQARILMRSEASRSAACAPTDWRWEQRPSFRCSRCSCPRSISLARVGRSDQASVR